MAIQSLAFQIMKEKEGKLIFKSLALKIHRRKKDKKPKRETAHAYLDIEADSDDNDDTNEQSEEAEMSKIQQARMFNEMIDKNVSCSLNWPNSLVLIPINMDSNLFIS